MSDRICKNCSFPLPDATAREMQYGQKCLSCDETVVYGDRDKINFLMEQAIKNEMEQIP